MKRFNGIIMAILAVIVMASPIDAQTRKKTTSAARTTTTTKKTTSTTRKTASTAKKTTAAVTKPEAVDMGLSVKWCNMDFGATNAKSAGKLSECNPDISKVMGEGWRLPSTRELQELFDNCTAELMLTSAGVPSHVKYTSKKNGASISFYFPKSFMIGADGSPKANPSNGTYMILLWGNNGSYAIVAKKMDYNLKSIMNTFFKKAGITSNNPADWPEEVRTMFENQLGKGAFIDGSKTYMGQAADLDAYNESLKILARPVFQLNDDE